MKLSSLQNKVGRKQRRGYIYHPTPSELPGCPPSSIPLPSMDYDDFNDAVTRTLESHIKLLVPPQEAVRDTMYCFPTH